MDAGAGESGGEGGLRSRISAYLPRNHLHGNFDDARISILSFFHIFYIFFAVAEFIDP